MDEDVEYDDTPTTELSPSTDTNSDSKAGAALVIAATAAIAGAAGYFGSKWARRKKVNELLAEESAPETDPTPEATPLAVVENDPPE
jgi:hypothetical protein